MLYVCSGKMLRNLCKQASRGVCSSLTSTRAQSWKVACCASSYRDLHGSSTPELLQDNETSKGIVATWKETMSRGVDFTANKIVWQSLPPLSFQSLRRNMANELQTGKVYLLNCEAATPQPKPSLEDFQHEEIVGPTVERDMSPVANELREAQMEMKNSMQKFTKALFIAGSVHIIWGALMFRVMDSPFSHAVMTQVCMSSLVMLGLAYHLKQTLKPIEFFTRIEERSRLRILTLSLQITKTLGSFFQRGYGIGMVLSFTLTAHLLACLKVFYF